MTWPRGARDEAVRVDVEGLGGAVEATCGVDNVVLEIIREENTLKEFDQAMHDLPDKGRKLGG